MVNNPFGNFVANTKTFADSIPVSFQNLLKAKTGMMSQNAGFIITDNDKNWTGYAKRLNIKYFDTDRIEDVSANYNAVKILGRSSPIHVYADGNAVRYVFKCWFIAEGISSGGYGFSSTADVLTPVLLKAQAKTNIIPSLSSVANQSIIEREVMYPVRWLKSLVYPVVDDNNLSYAPVSPVFVFGEAFASRVFIEKVTAVYSKTLDNVKLLPTSAEVTIYMIQNTNNKTAYTQKNVMEGDDTSFSTNDVGGMSNLLSSVGNAGTFLNMVGQL